MEERYEIAEQLRNQGKTFRQIGCALNVSVERARQLVLSARKLRDREVKYKDIPWFSLSTRTRNRILCDLFDGGHALPGEELPSPQQVRALVESRTIHKQLSNFGKISFRELQEWLKKHDA